MGLTYQSTRGGEKEVTASMAILQGLAKDGGLFMPSCIPQLDVPLEKLASMTYQETAYEVMKLFLTDYTEAELKDCIARAYDSKFDTEEIAPLAKADGAYYLELYHGSTIAFKDMALSILPHLMTTAARKNHVDREIVILTATSGDTGKAALEGFKDVPGTRILVFYPRDGVSDVQRLQMVTQSGDNVGVCAVEGNFDDAQTGVKRIFSDKELAAELEQRGWFLSSANSINWGRLLPQIAYYFSSYCDFVNAGLILPGEPMNFCVPTGNFGNILAGWIAKQMGLPVERFLCASNENNVLTDFINSGVYDKRRAFHLTNSPSMDILVSSNLERLLYFMTGEAAKVAEWMAQLSEQGHYDVGEELLGRISADFSAGFCTDSGASVEIARVWVEHGYLMDTHTAVASAVLSAYRFATGDETPTAVVSTASPYKFCTSVLNALGVNSDAPGHELIRELERVTGTRAPTPLASLGEKAERFTDCTAPEGMKKVVEDFLS
mgnify:CR=1 FL=1